MNWSPESPPVLTENTVLVEGLMVCHDLVSLYTNLRERSSIHNTLLTP